MRHRTQPQERSTHWWQELSAPQASVLAAVIALVPVTISGVASYVARSGSTEQKEEVQSTRLKSRLPRLNGYEPHTYPRLGIAFLAPVGWIVDDALQNFGDIALLRSYDWEKKGSGTEGLRFSFRAVPLGYVRNPAVEPEDRLRTLYMLDPSARHEVTQIAGSPAHRFAYVQRSGPGYLYVENYWLSLSERLRLEIFLVGEGTKLSDQLEREGKEILASFVIDRAVFSAADKKSSN
jgi:hypothetical protein